MHAQQTCTGGRLAVTHAPMSALTTTCVHTHTHTQSERALAACALAITDLQSRAAVLAAQRARMELVGRAEHASSMLRGPLDAWHELEVSTVLSPKFYWE
jgi:hypothetical protein